MNTILNYVSKDLIMDIPMQQEFAEMAVALISGENVIVGRKTFEQDMQEIPVPNAKQFILSRSHKFKGVKSVDSPEKFPGGYVLGGRSTIASFMPYAKFMILGVDNKEMTYGTMFPSLSDWYLAEMSEYEGFDFNLYIKK